MIGRFLSANKQNSFGFLFYASSSPDILVSVLQFGVKCPIRYRVSLLDSDGDKQFPFEYKWRPKSFPPSSEDDLEKYIRYDDLISFVRFQNNICRIFVEVDVLEDIASQVETKTDISADFGTLLETGKLSDMILSAGGKDFAVHKIILAARSPVFGAMFEHSDIREVQENRISIEDMSSDVCQVMLRHIYTGSIPCMSEFAFDLFVAADKYQLTNLKSVCERALIKLLDINSVTSVLLIADGCNALKLKSSCIKFITTNSVDVMKSDGWKQIEAKNDLLIELFGHLSKKSQPYFSNKKLRVK